MVGRADEMSTGQGSALRRRGLRTSGGDQQPPPLALARPTLTVSALLHTQAREGGASAPKRPLGPRNDTPALGAETAAAKRDAAQVEQAYETTKKRTGSTVAASRAAAEELADVTEGRPPAYVAQVTLAARPTLDLVSGQVASWSRKTYDSKKGDLEATMAALSTVSARGGNKTAEVIASSLAARLPDDAELSHVDNALFAAIGEGGDTTLARNLHSSLQAAGKTEAARGLADNEHGTDLEEAVVADARKQLDGGESAEAVAENFGGYLTGRIGRDLADERNEGMAGMTDLLIDLTEKGGPKVTESLAQQMAASLPDSHSGLPVFSLQLSRAMEQRRGVAFSGELLDQLLAEGKTQTADAVAPLVIRGVNEVKTEFDEAQAEVDRVNTELAYMVGAFGDLLTEDQRKAALDDFQQRHAAVYARLEAAAEDFGAASSTISYLADPGSDLSGLRETNRDRLRDVGARAMVNVVPRLGDTTAGSELLADALLGQAKGERTLIDVVGDLKLTDAQVADYTSAATKEFGVKSAQELQQAIGSSVFKAASLRVATRPGQADRLLEAISGNAALFGADAARLEGIFKDAEALAQATGPEAAAIEARLKTQTRDLEFLTADSRAGQAFRGFTAILGATTAVEGVRGFRNASNTDRLETLFAALDTGIGAYELVLGVTGRAASISSIAGKASTVLGGLGAVLEGVSAVQAFNRGDELLGTSHLMSALGGGLLAVGGASQAFPVAGQIVGGALIVGGLALAQYAKVRASNRYEGPAADFFRGAGLAPHLAEELANHTDRGFPAGPALIELSSYLNISGPELMRHLETLPEAALETLIESGVHQVDFEGDGDERAIPVTGTDMAAIRAYFEGQPAADEPTPQPHSLAGLALWMRYQGFLPPGTLGAE
ncbi:MAG: hypothetical protein JNK82_00035 [Myxococcaceae bacterium]|nr:hypothetical protein [Myxococcaceae bacterium]